MLPCKSDHFGCKCIDITAHAFVIMGQYGNGSAHFLVGILHANRRIRSAVRMGYPEMLTAFLRLLNVLKEYGFGPVINLWNIMKIELQQVGLSSKELVDAQLLTLHKWKCSSCSL